MTAEAVPQGARLLHIGPAKTGTSTLQSGFHHNREALLSHGVRYAGPNRQVRSAAAAIALKSHIPGYARSTMGKWDELVAEVQGAQEPRVMISSETFAHADDATADTIIEAFGADRLHIAITFRPLADLLPSAWQQYVVGSLRASYDEWLHGVLEEDLLGEHITPSFWRRTRIDKVAGRWADRLGADRVTFVSLADRPRDFVLREFEKLLSLPEGLLQPDESESNFSVPHPVAEVLRHFNELFKSEEDFSLDEHARLIEFGAVDVLKRGGGGEVAAYGIQTPTWAVERAAEIQADINTGLRQRGINLVGDLDALTASSKPGVADAHAPATISTDDAAVLMNCMMVAAKREGAREERRTRPSDEVIRESTGGRELSRLLARKVRSRLPGARR